MDRVKDGRRDGYTQLWAGISNSLHEQEILLSRGKGKYRGLTLQRVQPIGGPVAVNLSVGRTWYHTPVADYRGTTASIGLAITGWPKI